MREIKFRAWDQSNKRMMPHEDLSVGLKNINKCSGFVQFIYMQYSGLTDKNGTEIYEGDVIYIAGFGDYEAEFPFHELYERVFSGDGDDIESIKGNIYNTPALLNQ